MAAGDLVDRVAAVTGGGRGIGRAICLVLAGYGADVAVADIDSETALETCAEVDKLGRRSLAIEADVAEEQSVAAW